jgi:hypothetical protein
MDKIIVMDEENECWELANVIKNTFCNKQAIICLYNNVPLEPVNNLYLVGHANALCIGDYNFSDLKTHFSNHLKKAKALYLAGCSTNDGAALLLNNGFVPTTLAKNIKSYLGTEIKVYGTPGVLVLDNNKELSVIAPLSSGCSQNDIFVEVIK